MRVAVEVIDDPARAELVLLDAALARALPDLDLMNRLPVWLTVLIISRDVVIVLTVAIVNLAVGHRTFRPSHRDSLERLCHDASVARFLLDFDAHQALQHRLVEPRLQRFIGVIYRPDTELMSHYAEASVSRQFDAFVWFDETSAVTPLGAEHGKPGVPDTYPFGL